MYQTIKDVSKIRDWKPGVVICNKIKTASTKSTKTSSPQKSDHGMGQDVVQEVIINPKCHDSFAEEVIPQHCSRYKIVFTVKLI